MKNNEFLYIPSFNVFNNDWETLQQFLERRGNPLYSVGGDLYLRDLNIETLGNLTSVGGRLNLRNTPIQSLGNLTSVGRDLNLRETPISEKYSEKEIRQMVEIGEEIYL